MTPDIVAHIQGLRRYARFLCRDVAEADDLVQETLERAIAHAGQFRPGGDLRVWLFAILHNAFVSGRRAYARRRTETSMDLASAVSVSATQESRAELQRVLSAIDRLPDERRRVLLLVAVEGLTTDEVAVALGLPVGTVRSRLARARDSLRQLLGGRGPAGSRSATMRVVGGRDVDGR
ncbi:MAG: sigma-70 family RNA polymerase sigma factor [Alphaproteobacteria bacterium]|nr:sigma-70 family RNA polymerase sigma factor [Alphaproteobacteria bacterium]